VKALVGKALLNSLSRRCRHAVLASGEMQPSVEITSMCGTDFHINCARPPLPFLVLACRQIRLKVPW
jgi:hypothetical protein